MYTFCQPNVHILPAKRIRFECKTTPTKVCAEWLLPNGNEMGKNKEKARKFTGRDLLHHNARASANQILCYMPIIL